MPGASEQEPSIEEILASIRQIISDDDDHPPTAPGSGLTELGPPPAEPVREAAPLTSPPTPPPALSQSMVSAPVTPPPPLPQDDILDLTDPLPDEDDRPMIDLEDSTDDEPFRIDMVADEPEAEPEPVASPPVMAPPPPSPPPVRPPEPKPPVSSVMEESILTDAAKQAALSGFSKLTGSGAIERGTTPHVSASGATLEDIVRDMMTPMLRAWLDENLPEIIEKLVQKELDKLARKARDD